MDEAYADYDDTDDDIDDDNDDDIDNDNDGEAMKQMLLMDHKNDNYTAAGAGPLVLAPWVQALWSRPFRSRPLGLA